MKKILILLIILTASLTAAPKAVVFDWGNVLATSNRTIVVDFLCETFNLSKADFEIINLKKRKTAKTDIDFWMKYAKENHIQLPNDWPQIYQSILKTSIGLDFEMFALVNELKDNRVGVCLLSNIDSRHSKLIRDFGFYQLYNPCLLSCEIGVEKPDPKAYEILLQSLNLPAEEVIFIDDKPENIAAAKNVGIDAILFKSAVQIREELEKRGLLTYL